MATIALALNGGGYSVAVRGIAEIIVWWLVGVGLVVRWWPVSGLPRTAMTSALALAGLMALTALSMLWVENDARILEEVVRIAGYLGLFVLVVLASSDGQARPWLAGLVIGLVAVAGIGILSRVEPTWFPDQNMLATLTGSFARLSYPLNYWNAMGAAMAPAVILLTFFGADAGSRAWRVAATAVLPVPALALYMTSSRGSILAAGLGIAILLALSPARWRIVATLALAAPVAAGVVLLLTHSQQLFDGQLTTPEAGEQGDRLLLALLLGIALTAAARYALDGRLPRLDAIRLAQRTRWIAGGLAVVAILAAVIAANPSKLVDDFTAEPTNQDFSQTGFVRDHLSSASGTGRYQYWHAAVDAFADHPVLGIGPARYVDFWLENGKLTHHVRDAHSLPLEIAAELGLVGLALLLGFLVPPFVAAWRNRRQAWWLAAGGPAALAILCSALLSSSIDWMWEVPSAFAAAVIGAGLLTGAALRGRDDKAESGNYTLGVLTVIVGWMAVCASVVILLTDAQLGRSRDAVRAGDLPKALDAARQAQVVQPWAAEPRLQRALVLERTGDIAGARAALQEAIDRAPSDWSLWIVAARMERRLGNEPAALAALARARKLNPDSLLFREEG